MALVYWIVIQQKKAAIAEIGNPKYIFADALQKRKAWGKKSIKLALHRKSEHIYNRRSMEWANQ